MKLRSLALVVAVLAVLSLGVYWLRRPAPPTSADPRVGQPLVDAANVEKAARLRLTDNGKTVLLVRQPDATWRVASYYDFPADFSKLSQFVGELTSAQLQRLVTSRADRISRLEFKGTQIALLDSAEKPLWSVDLGKNADGGGRYVRFGDEQRAYLANLNAWIDTEPKNWADAGLVHLKPDDVTEIDVTFPDAPAVKATRAKKGDAFAAEAPPAGQKLNTGKLTSLLNTVTGLRFSDTTAPDDAAVQAAQPHARTITLKTFDGKTLTVTLARKPEEKKLKPPAPDKAGVAALGTSADLVKQEADAKDGAPAADAKPAAKVEPEYETIPAGPVFVTVTSSDAAAPINELMKKRAFKVYDYTFTSLPQHAADLFEAAPPPPAPAPAATPAAGAASESTPPAPQSDAPKS